MAHGVGLQTQGCEIDTNAIPNGSRCARAPVFSYPAAYEGLFLSDSWIALRIKAAPPKKRNLTWIQGLHGHWHQPPMWEQRVLNLLTRAAAGSTEQLLSPFLFTSGYDVLAALLVFKRGLCCGNAGWQMFPFVSDRRAAAMIWRSDSFIVCFITSTPVLLVLSPGGEVYLRPFRPTQ